MSLYPAPTQTTHLPPSTFTPTKTTASSSTTSALSAQQSLPPISLTHRLCISFGYTIFGLLFFYLFMVLQSSMSKQIILDRLPSNSWTRTASRQTGANSLPPLLLFLLSNKRSTTSLFWSVMLACAVFAHFVIISSDGRVFADDHIFHHMRTEERLHPLFTPFPFVVWRGVGIIGFLAALWLPLERVWGPALRRRSEQLPLLSRAAVAYLVAVFTFYYIDRLVAALLMQQAALSAVLYPVCFLTALLAASTYRATERKLLNREHVEETAKTAKKDL